MNARIPTKSAMQEIQAEYDESLKKIQAEYDRCLALNTEQAQTNAIKLCTVTLMQSFVDVGFADSTVDKVLKRWRSYINSVRAGNVTYEEIAENLEEEKGIRFDWIGE